MISSTGKLTTKAVAVIVIVAMLDAVGLSPVIMVFVTTVVFVVWVVVRRAQTREVERILDFYAAADAILREEERRWYGFEVAEVIEQGENLLETMPDSPPLHYFALGALYHRLGNHQATAAYLSQLNEDEHCDEGHCVSPSPQLRRYVRTLRRIEYHPSLAPETLAAVRSLERARRKNAARMLTESRDLLESGNGAGRAEIAAQESREVNEQATFAAESPLSSISAPPPISQVLHDIYQEETTASN